MASEQEREVDYLEAYRERSVDATLEDHERRITNNERRWLMAKGAFAMLATIKGVDFAVGQLMGLI